METSCLAGSFYMAESNDLGEVHTNLIGWLLKLVPVTYLALMEESCFSAKKIIFFDYQCGTWGIFRRKGYRHRHQNQ